MSSPALPARGGPGEAQPSLETMERRFRALVGGLLALAVSSCLFFAVTSKRLCLLAAMTPRYHHSARTPIIITGAVRKKGLAETCLFFQKPV